MQPPADDRLEAELLRHGPFLRRLARSLVRDEHAAEDLVHDTWLAALRGAPAESRDLRAWLAKVLQRRATSGLRSQGRATDERYARERSATVPSAEAAALALERERLLLDAVDGLDEPYRTAIYLRYHEELPPRRIAARLGLPQKTVATRLERGRAQLRQRLDRSFTERDDARAAWLAALAPLVVPARPNPTLLGASLMTKSTLSVASLALLGWLLYPSLAGGEAPAARPGSEVARAQPAASESILESAEPVPSAAPPTRVAASGADLATGLIEVVVIDEAGEPVPDYPVAVDGPRRGGARRTVTWGRTDVDGRAQFEHPRAGSHLIVDGFARSYRTEDGVARWGHWVEVETGGSYSFTLTLQPGLRIEGTVVLPDGSPAPFADLWAGFNAGFPDRRVRIASADEGGRFELDAGPELVLQAVAAGRVASNGLEVSTMAEVRPGVRRVELVLGAPGSTLVGRVVDPAGVPVVGARVGAGPFGNTVSGAWVGFSPARVTVRTDAEGRFVYPNALPIGATTVSVDAPGFGATVRELESTGAALDLEVSLRPAASVAGVVRRADGSVAPGVEVVLHPPGAVSYLPSDLPHVATRTAEDGTYELLDASAGALVLAATTPYGEPRATAHVELDLEPGEARELDLVLGEGDVIAGRVVDREGVAVSGVRLNAEGFVNRALGSASSGADGAFRLTGLATPRGLRHETWTIVARKLSASSIQELARIESVAVGTEDLVVTVDRPLAATGFLQGRLVADSPRVPADVELTVWRADTNSGHFASFEPDSGQFRYGPLAPGSYRIQARRSEEVVATRSGIEIADGETVDVGAITLGAGGRAVVTPRLADRHGLPAEIDDILLGEGTATITHEHGVVVWLEVVEGRWASDELLEPGTWTFRAEGEKTLYPTIEFQVVEGESTEFDCLARLGHEAEARVLLPPDGWERVRIAMGHVDDGLVHRTEWRTRGVGADETFELTLPIGEVRIAVETEDGVLLEAQREILLMERPEDFELDAR